MGTASLDDYGYLADVGPWQVYGSPDLPGPSLKYFLGACSVAWECLKGCGIYPAELIGGPVVGVPAELKKAGWYVRDEDTAFTEAVQTLKAGIAGSELITVKGVGHNPHEEAPGVFNEALLKFLDKIKW